MVHTLVAWVEDRPGVLAHVASMFRRRGFNIQSLTVGQSERPGLSRMTIVVETERLDASLVEACLHKLVDVVDVQDVTQTPSVLRELALVKVKVEGAARIEVAQLAELLRGKVVDVQVDSVIVEASGNSDRIDHLIEVLRPKGPVEIMRTGCVAMTRGWKTAPEPAEPAAEPAKAG
jgi:acetolactate synthase-1/3 small subunit